MENLVSYLYQTIQLHYQEAIQNGQLGIGQKLPSLRQVCAQFDCALSVAQQAYAELLGQGLVVAHEKSGYFVAAPSQARLPRPEANPLARKPRIPQSQDLVSRVLSLASDPRIVPLHMAIPADSLLPLKSIRRQLQQVLHEEEGWLARYTPAAGSLALRQELSKFLLGHGISAQPEEILITNGCSEALRLAIDSCSGPGDVVAIETPAYFGMISLLELMGRRAIGIPTRADTGLDLDALERILARENIRACLVTPNFQNPLGALMPDEHKHRLGKLAQRHGFVVIEDDIYGDCSATAKRPLSLRALAPDAPVIYCNSFAKTIAPGLRLGFCIPPKGQTAMVLAKQRGTLGGPAALQESFARFLANGSYQRHIQPFRRLIAAQTHAMAQLVRASFPQGTLLSQPQGGFFLWLELPHGISSLDLFEKALRHGIGFVPGPAFSLQGSNYHQSLRISCAQPLDTRITQAVETLGALALAMHEESR